MGGCFIMIKLNEVMDGLVDGWVVRTGQGEMRWNVMRMEWNNSDDVVETHKV
jgi:hypothetical protein